MDCHLRQASSSGRNVNTCSVWNALLRHLNWRNRETDEHLKGAVENIKDFITGQAISPLAPLAGGYDDAEITSATLGAGNRISTSPKYAPLSAPFSVDKYIGRGPMVAHA